MSLTFADIEKIAHLARLTINENEHERYTQQLSGILDFIAHMDTVDTNQVDPLAHPLNLSQRLREDAVTETDQHEKFQKIAPLVAAGLYLVPKVIDEE